MNQVTASVLAAWACVIIATAALAVGVVNSIVKASTHRVDAEARATCLVQARGLPAAHKLARAMGDIGILLTPADGQAKHPDLTPTTLHALLDLRQKAQEYAAIIAKQPQTRKC